MFSLDVIKTSPPATAEEGEVSAVASPPETHTSRLMQPLQTGNNLTAESIT